MLIEFDEILHDLELKRAAALAPVATPDDRRRGRAGGAVGPGADGCSCAFATRTATSSRSRRRWPAQLVGDALSTLAAASGELDADTAAGREIVRATTARVVTRAARLTTRP